MTCRSSSCTARRVLTLLSQFKCSSGCLLCTSEKPTREAQCTLFGVVSFSRAPRRRATGDVNVERHDTAADWTDND